MRAKDVCTGHAQEDIHCAGMVVDSTVAFGDAVAAQCVGLREGVPARSRRCPRRWVAELWTAWLGGCIAALLDWLPASFIAWPGSGLATRVMIQ